MKRLFPMFAMIALILTAASLGLAQNDPFVGTWKLNVAQSKFEPGPAPQSQMRTWDKSGKVSVEGVNAAGKPAGYWYIIKFDVNSYATSGTVPNGADMMTAKKIDANTVEANFTKAGKHVETATFKVSKDGKTMNITAKGVLPTGQMLNNDTLWDRQ
jgi:hypothetical protein